jgi:hypothetical protein
VSLLRSLWERGLRRLAPRDPHWWEQLLSPEESVGTTYEFRHHRFALVKPALYGLLGVLSFVAGLLLLPVGEWYSAVIYVLLALSLGVARVAHVLWRRSAVALRAARLEQEARPRDGEADEATPGSWTPAERDLDPPPPALGRVDSADSAESWDPADPVHPVARERVLVRTLPREPAWTTVKAPDHPRPDPVTLAMAGLCAIAAGVLAAAGLGLWMSSHPSWLLAVLGVLTGTWAVYSWLSVSRDRLYVTTHRVIKLNRLFSQTVAVMPITRLVDLTVHEPWLGRVLGFGHFTFESAAQRQGLASFRTVPDPLKLSLLIQRRALGMTNSAEDDRRGSSEGT